MTTSLPTTCSENPTTPSGANASAAAMLGAFAAILGAPAGANPSHATPGAETPATLPSFESLLVPVASVASEAEAAVSPQKIMSGATIAACNLPSSRVTPSEISRIDGDAGKSGDDEATEMPIDRTTLEAALALLVSVVVPVRNDAPPACASALEGGAMPEMNTDKGEAALPASQHAAKHPQSAPPAAPVVVRVSVSAPNKTAEFAVEMSEGEPSQTAIAATPTAAARVPTAAPTPGLELPAEAKAGESAVRLVAPETARRFDAIALATESESTEPESPLIVQAELEVQPGVRVMTEFAAAEPRGYPVATPSGRDRAMQAAATAEKNAAESAPPQASTATEKSVSEKNVLNAGSSEVASPVRKAGIAVAKERADMSAALPHSNFSAASVRAAMPAEQMAESARPVSENTAQRAVDTVVSLVHAQAVSKLQPVPSVQLRFKVGSEDLAVRVELRDGEVRTEFRTENAELRAAVAQEWRAVTAKPDAALRFLDPVFPSGANNNSANGHGGSASQQNSQQSHAQQQQYRTQMELFGSVRRAFPAAGHAPELAPVTSLSAASTHRLSAVA